MQLQNVPRINPRYWIAIIAASMCGANMGDFVSEVLGFGNAAGILPILLIFFVIVWAERRAVRSTELYYWLAIIALRTVATNLADYSEDSLKLSWTAIELGLTAILIACVAAERLWRRRGADMPVAAGSGAIQGVPVTDAAYWAAMLAAGTLGTATGDFVQGRSGLGFGPGVAAVITLSAFAIALLLALRVGLLSKPWYWAVIVAARTAGTNLGDFLASRRGVGLGLPLSLTCTAILFALVVIAWRNDSLRLALVADR